METKVSIISCVAQNGVIGKNGIMPWNNKEDMKFFKEKTINHPVIMGRKTFDSIGHPLKDRFNVVITKNEQLYNFKTTNPFGPLFVPSLVDAIDAVDGLSNETFIIGGNSIYDDAIKLELVDKMYLNVLNENYQGDTFFPYYEKNDWIVQPAEEKYETFKSYVLYKKSSI